MRAVALSEDGRSHLVIRAIFNALGAGGFGQSPLMIAPNLARGLHTEYLCSELE